MRYSLVVLAAPVMFLVAAACSPMPAPAAAAALPTGQVTVVGTDDFRMTPSTITVKAGQPLEVTFQNSGEILHDFTAQQGLARSVTILEQGGQFSQGPIASPAS
jgi:uncharacterized cupredoxin-like copper-binding protein